MLVTLKEILIMAEEKQIAIGAFNVANLESLQAEVFAAEELGLPVIIQYAPVHEMFNSLSLLGPLMLDFARHSTVPICVHLDHGTTLDQIESALKLGFTSVMFDGSVLPYAENVSDTLKASKMAHAAGASIEAELGCMGRTETGGGETQQKDESKIYTDPRLAADFVSRTNIDALACSFGTTHGIYLKAPHLDFSIVEQVRSQTSGIPVVMHGGSGVSLEDYQKAIKAGVRKINYFTYMDLAAGKAVKQWGESFDDNACPFYTHAASIARSAMKDDVMKAMKTFAFLD